MEKSVLDKTYDPKAWEGEIYADWEKSDLFRPDANEEKERYSNILPPPNANGELHLGHASGYTVMDIFGRYERMKGKRVLLLPGKDHAGIQTQVVFEKKLEAEQDLTRHDLGREKFFQATYDFCLDRAQYMRSQEKRVGLSADWSREKFTLDPEISKRALATFEKMYRDGLIYRGERIINWCPRCATALSDIEVVHTETEGKLYSLRYPIKDSTDSIVVATTRPETLLGDSAVAVHPDDARYKNLVGKIVVLPLLGREIPIIADKRIEQDFGTGAVKITPAHDPLDWAIGEDHQLKKFSVIGQDGNITSLGGPYVGLTALEARDRILADLERDHLIDKVNDHGVNISKCERCKSVVEPLISKQWFVNVDAKEYSLKKESVKALKKGALAFYPESMQGAMIHWLENLHDWCISRQLWWGHRIPVWYCLGCKHEVVNPTVKSKWFLVRHGETDSNKEQLLQGNADIPLNETGRQQAQRAAEKLQQDNIEVIFSSDMSRAKETAEIIREKTSVEEVIIDSRLRERSMGKAEGLRADKAREQYPELYHYRGKPAENESYEETEHRIWEAVSEHLSKHRHKNVVVVSHGAALRSLLRRIKNVDPELFDGMERIPNATPIPIDILETPCSKCGGHFFEQDPDTLDTWFSSGQWPYTTLGYPEADDAKKFYPTDMMIMGRDLLFFWATRMVMFGLYSTGTIPFRELYFTGLVRDKDGQKMSKSKGNGIDVLEMIDRYGADAVRLSLFVGTTPGLDFRLSDEKIANFRNFANKLWNMGRYVQSAVADSTLAPEKIELLHPADHWILSELEKTITMVTANLDKRNLSLAAETLHDFTWNDMADWYIEIHKIEKNDALLIHVYRTLLLLWHPFIPFVTEALWSSLFKESTSPLMAQVWPQRLPDSLAISPEKREVFLAHRELVIRLRTLRSLYRIDPKTPLDLTLVTDTKKEVLSLTLIEKLGRTKTLTTTNEVVQPAGSMHIWGGSSLHGFVQLTDIIDIEKEKARLEKEIDSLRHFLDSLRGRLANPTFIERAPESVVSSERQSLVQSEEKLALLEEALSSLNSIAV